MVFKRRKSPFGILPQELVGEKIVEDLQTKALKKKRATQETFTAAEKAFNVRRRRVGDLVGSFNI